MPTKRGPGESEEVIWGLPEYALYVPMTDEFYQNLTFQRISRSQVNDPNRPKQQAYKDSRTYMRVLVNHLGQHYGEPHVLDVGGYIGRFSIEAALLGAELDKELNILCFEPGATYELLQKNLALNDMTENVRLLNLAVSDSDERARFAIADYAMISSRIIPRELGMDHFGSRWREVEVQTARLGDCLAEFCTDGLPGFICKIDTEGHEVKVIEGIGEDRLQQVPHALIIEFWPSLLKEQLFGVPFGTYVLNEYEVFDIRSSLYPAEYTQLSNFDDIVRMIEKREATNRDLLLIRKSVKNLAGLVRRIGNLAD